MPSRHEPIICAWPDCETIVNHGPLCGVHLGQRYGNNGVGRRKPYLTTDQRADIAKRLRRFENPLALAREYGVTISTIRGCLK